jgi:hypothetical protein
MTFNNKKIILAALVLILAPLIAFLAYQQNQFRLVSATPGTIGEFATSTSTIRLTFNKALDGTMDYRSFVEGETAAIRDMYVEDKNLYIFLGLLPKGSEVTFTVNNIRSVDGRVIESLPFEFTAVYVPYDKLSKQQRELELYVTDKGIIQDPVIEILPYQGDRFYISTEYTNEVSDDSKPIITAQLFLTRADILVDKDSAIDEYKKRVRDYILSKGINPDEYEFKYELNAPPVTVEGE